MAEPVASREPGSTLTAHPAYTPFPATGPQRGPVSNKQATWAFVLALLPVPVGWLISVPLAIGVLRDSRDGRGRERGSGLAKAALVLVPLWVVALVAVVANGSFSDDVARSASGEVTSAGDVSTSALRPGDCLRDAPRVAEPTRTVGVVPCADEHAGQVYAVLPLPLDARPSAEQLRGLAETACTRQFTAIRTEFATQGASLFYFLPRTSLGSSDRNVVCIAVPQGGATQGA